MSGPDTWNARAATITACQRLIQALNRVQDAAQEGKPLPSIGQQVSAYAAARAVYEHQVAASGPVQPCCEDGPPGHTAQQHHDASACYDQGCAFDHPQGGPFPHPCEEGRTPSPTGAYDVIEVLSYGEDGEWLVAEGHVPLDAFVVAAEAEARRLDYDLDESEPFTGPPRHRWMRPILRSDCETDEEFAWKQADDWHMWTDDGSEPGAEPITLVGVWT